MSVELSRLLGAFVLILGCRSERVSIGRDRVSDAVSPNPAGAGGQAATGGDSPGAGAAAVQGGAGAGGVPGLVAHWPLDETSGLVAHDSTENHNDGALTSFQTSGWTEGKVGGSLAFANGPYIVVEPSPSLDAVADNDAVTVGAWVRSNEHGSWFESVLSVQLEDGVWETFGLYLNQGIATMVVNTGNGVGECAGTATIPLGTWVHLAGTFDGSVVRTFVNGVEECRLVPGELDIPRSLNPVLIGSNQNLAQPGEFMRGTLDEVVLYARALSPEEIGTLVAGGRP